MASFYTSNRLNTVLAAAAAAALAAAFDDTQNELSNDTNGEYKSKL